MWRTRQTETSEAKPTTVNHVFKNTHSYLYYPRGPNKRLETFMENKKTPEESYYNRCLDKTRPLWYRCLWSITLSFSICICIYQIVDRFCFYLSEPIATDIVALQNGSIKYPSFTICPSSEHIPQLIPLRKNLVKKINSTIPFCLIQEYQLIDNDLLPNFTTLWSYLDARKLGIQMAFYSTSRFEYLPINVTQNIVRTTFGDCVTLTIPEMLSFSGYEVAFGIQFPTPKDECYWMQTSGLIYAHEDVIEPKYMMNFHGVSLYKNQVFYLKMTAKHYKNMNVTRNLCTDDDTYKACYTTCVEKIFQLKLICKTPQTDLLDLPECWNSTVVYKSIADMVSILKETNPKLDCGCKRRCKETIYEFDLQFARTQAGLTIIAPVFRSNTFEVVTEKRLYSLISLICDTGGNCGLFLGLCILSVLDAIFEFITSHVGSKVK